VGVEFAYPTQLVVFDRHRPALGPALEK
jgi:hypothetical protein